MRLRKSKSLRKVFVRIPSGASVVHYKPKTGKAPRCPVTGTQLPGIKKARPSQLRRMPKSAKRVARPFGGMLSSWAARREIIASTRS
ncbi:MAG: 50S ribosomal protein L34e [Candidatus Woesearchaeota archaeon]